MHTGSTDNYNLTQFASSDKPAWLIDYNEDMRKIDAGMKDNADAIDGLGESIGQEGEDITDLKERMNIAEQDIDTVQETIGVGELETEVKTLIGACNELLGLIHDNDGNITQLQQALAGVGESITGLSQLAYTIANVYDSARTYEVGNYAIYLNTLYKCVTAITVGEPFDPAKWTSVKVMNEINGSTPGPVPTVVTAEQVGYDNTDSGLDATNVQAAIDEIVTNVNDAVNELTSDINDVTTELAKVEVQHGTIAAGETSATLTFASNIGATTIVDWYVGDGTITPISVTASGHTVVITIEAQSAATAISAVIRN